MKNHINTTTAAAARKAPRKILLSGDGTLADEMCHTIRPHGLGDVSLSVNSFTDWTQVAWFLDSGRRLSVLPKGHPVPYDKVEIEFNRARRRWIIGKSTKTGKAFIHCLMPFGRGILLSL